MEARDRYLGRKQRFQNAVNDASDLNPAPHEPEVITTVGPTYRYKPVPVSALAIYHSSRKSLESQLQRSIARQAGGAS